MPIRPENRKRYPSNWKKIREDILTRAENRCEFCGLRNHMIGYREADGSFVELLGMAADIYAEFGHKIIKIILTIAHLDHTPENNDPANLRALCQKCHNGYDAKTRAAGKKRRAQDATGQVELAIDNQCGLRRE